MKKYAYFVPTFVLLLLINCCPAQNKILFDTSKGESAGNADWVIDADLHNLGVNSGGAYLGGNESNAQQIPTPAQSGITATTNENYWKGALSSWAVDCVKAGFTVESLPWNGNITYGISSNPMDLSHYKAFVVDEPNIIFTAAQKAAIVNFVAGGGGLFMISDHDNSDRNGDGYDSPHIWNDLMQNNSVATNPFGITFDYNDISGTYNNIPNLPGDPILHGTSGDVTQTQFSNGTTMTLSTANNATIKGALYRTGTSGLLNVICAYGLYGNGKVVAVGDSSIADDGTGDSGDSLYDGYLGDANGNHKKLLMNSIKWLMASTLSSTSFSADELHLTAAPNPGIGGELHVIFESTNSATAAIDLYDTLGRQVFQQSFATKLGRNELILKTTHLVSGLYVCRVSNGIAKETIHVTLK